MTKLNQIILAAAFLMPSCAQTQKSKNLDPAPAASAPAQVDTQVVGLSRDQAYQNLIPLADDSELAGSVPERHKEFSITLPVERPRVRGGVSTENDWQWSKVTVFYKDPRKIDQVAIEAVHCNVEESLEMKSKLEERVRELVPQISAALFGQPYRLAPETGYFKELGPHWKKQVRVSIREAYPPAKSMRLKRGFYKCDGRSGFGFRFDFFLPDSMSSQSGE